MYLWCVCVCVCVYVSYRECAIQFRYLLGCSSNMAIVDVEVPSGYIYTGWRIADEFVSVTVVIEMAACHAMCSLHVVTCTCMFYLFRLLMLKWREWK